jgi:lysophospholipase L1-like esterase
MQKWRIPLVSLLAATVAAAAFAVSAAKPVQAAVPVRIMALGDSITGSPGCWRALLWQRLQNTGFTNIDFVGTLPPQGCGFPYDGENEGHGGFLATNVANQNQLVGWLAATLPDIVVMHFGTNDVWNNIAPATILTAFSRLVDQMRASNPTMKILVAKIIPMNPSNCPDCGQRVVNFNNAIPAWAAGKTTTQSPITVVDQWTGFSTSADTTDGVHPNSTTGIQKISDRWYPPLVAALNGITPPPTTASPTGSPTRSPTASPTTSNPPPPGGCQVAYTISPWGTGSNGFTAGLTLTNTGTTPLTWTLRFTLPTGQAITPPGWSATWTQTAQNITATGLSWNATLQPGQNTSIGFNGTHTGNTSEPTAFTVNNSPCQIV